MTNEMMEYWKKHHREGRRIAVQAVGPTALRCRIIPNTTPFQRILPKETK